MRKTWVDMLRGLAIILVIFGHCLSSALETGYFVFTSPVKMPLFFLIAGYCFNARGGDVLAFSKHIFTRLVVPWLVLGIAPLIVASPLKGVDWLWNGILDVLTGKALWFMPCFIISQVILFLTLKFVRNDIAASAISVALSAFGFLMASNGGGNLFMIKTAFSVSWLMMAGHIFRKYEDSFRGLDIRWTILMAGVYIGLGVLSMRLYPGKCLDVHTVSYYDLILCLAMIISGNLALFLASPKLEGKLLPCIGRHTLMIYIWGSYASVLCIYLMKYVGLALPAYLNAFVVTVFSVAICTLLSIMANRYAPWIVGSPACRLQKIK